MMNMRLSKRRSNWGLVAAIAGCGGAVMLSLLMVPQQSAQARQPLGKNWPEAQHVAIAEIDHAAFDRLLKKYVDDDGYVNYSAWNGNSIDRQILRAYLADLGRASAKKPAERNAQLAFWINAYNAVTLEGILDVYPTTSIRNHTAKIAGFNIWKDLPLQVGGQTFSLEAIEHHVLRKMGDPRIHFAIVCASVGCPRLRNEAYRADKLEQQLADNARDFFSRPQNLRFEPKSRVLHFSAILDWFGDDFGVSQSQQLNYLKPYLPQSVQAAISSGRVTIKYLDYDWSLNDQSRKRETAAKH